ncbi:MAG: cyclic nucleotide-binding domain-containing protein [Pseudomonadota bacterium]
MSLEDEVALLRSAPLFAEVATAQLKLLAFASDRQQYAAGSTLCVAGESGHECWLLLDGEVEIEIPDGAGTRSLGTRGRGTVIGETAVLCRLPRTATVRAVSDTDTLCIRGETFTELLRGSPDMCLKVIEQLGQYLYRQSQQPGNHPEPPSEGTAA